MDTTQLLGLATFTSYFLIIITLFTIIIRSLPSAPTTTTTHGLTKIYAFRFLTLGSLAHTWFYILKYMYSSFVAYELVHPTSTNTAFIERLTTWLANTRLFEQAWIPACSQPVNWWLSEQICLFTVGAWLVFLFTEGKKYNIKHLWAYMLLGQLVAISVASNLFYLAILLAHAQSQPQSKNRTTTATYSTAITFCTILAFITVAYTPNSLAPNAHVSFLPNLLTMHALVVLPLIPFFSNLSSKFSLSSQFLYGFSQIASLGIHLRTTLSVMTVLPGYPLPPSQVPSTISSRLYDLYMHFVMAYYVLGTEVWRVLRDHPAQASIGWDVIWTCVSLLVWAGLRPDGGGAMRKGVTNALFMLVVAPAGLAVAASDLFLWAGEEEEEEEVVSKED